MSTWICKGLIAASLLSLMGCDEVVLPFGGKTQSQALASAAFGRGAVTLVPPLGFCIDRKSLRQNFALMARCDTLGAEAAPAGPLAVITATAIGRVDGAVVTAKTLGAGSETVLSHSSSDGMTVVQVQGTPPQAVFADVYWRSVAEIGDQIIGLAIYEAQDNEGLGGQAPQLLVETIQRTARKTAANAAQGDDKTTASTAKPIGNTAIASLSE